MSQGVESGGASVQNGCNVCVSSWLDRYESIEEEVRTTSASLSEQAIKQEASKRFMLSVYVPDVTAVRREWRGEDKIPHDAYELTENGLVVKYAGKQEQFENIFIENPLKKGIISLEEAETLRLAVSTIRQTDTQEVRFLVHNIEQGGEKIRYESRWQRVGNKVIPTMHRLPRQSQDATVKEAQTIIKNQVPRSFQEVRPAEGISVVYRKTQAVKLTLPQPALREDFHSNHVPDVPMSEKSASPRFDSTHFREQISNQNDRILQRHDQQPAHILNFVRHIVQDIHGASVDAHKYIFGSHKQEKERNDGERKNPRPHEVKSSTEHRQGEKKSELKQSQVIIFERPLREQSPKRQKAVFKEKIVALALLPDAERFGLGFAVLATLAKELPPSEVKRKRSSKQTKREAFLRKKEPKRAASKRESREVHQEKRKKSEYSQRRKRQKRLETLRKSETSRRTERRKKRMEREATASRRGGKEIKQRRGRRGEWVKQMSFERPLKMKPKERKRIRRVFRRMIRMRASRHTSTERQRGKLAKQEHKNLTVRDKPRVQEQEKPIFLNVFAWAIFLLLMRSDPKPQNSSVPSLEVRESKKELVPEKEKTPWVLLSIIWYLAMIRESGRGSKRQQPVLPVQGVIFAASS